MEIEVSWEELFALLKNAARGSGSNTGALRANAVRVLGSERGDRLVRELDAGRTPQIVPRSEDFAASTQT